jgi:hypothetical protein
MARSIWLLMEMIFDNENKQSLIKGSDFSEELSKLRIKSKINLRFFEDPSEII